MPYVFAPRSALEQARLAGLERVHDPLTTRTLADLGVRPGTRCLEVGAGRGSIARWLAGRVGAGGEVVATDVDVDHFDVDHFDVDRLDVDHRERVDSARVRVVRHDVTTDPRPGGPYDLIHARFLLAHLPDPAAVACRLAGWLAPGGALVVEDIDYAALGFHPLTPCPAVTAAATAALEHVRESGFDPAFGRRLPGLLAAAGLAGVDGAWRTAPMAGGSPEIAYFTAGLERLRPELESAGRIAAERVDAALARCADPAFALLAPLTVAAWGRAAG